MKKIILTLIILSYFTSLMAIEKLSSLSQLEESKYTFLVFEKNGCPWCSRYKSELDFIIDKYKNKITFYKVKKGSDIFSEFRKKYGIKVIIYPMTYIFKKDDKNKAKIVNEIYGYQTSQYIEEDVFSEVFKSDLSSKH